MEVALPEARSPDDGRLAYTVTEFCQAARISRSTVYALMSSGKLRTVRVGGRRMVPVESARALFQGEAA
jgi:excisionase family DNA binding protein